MMEMYKMIRRLKEDNPSMTVTRYMDVIVDSVTAYNSVHGGAYNKEATGYQQDILIVEDS